ncbi:2-methylfumaryl-CoA isomerase [Sulfitobacter sp. JBTF-M27]|uniref:2-methylfumaryl-CoA isomerase n=1 Tax=Sulfitobacter sediminilitoris TaxID=2698830 RepID=A0A6P0CA59_9RHOB|nr:CoA transferase [Sulfitobacter sediminilitoris]NEK23002.1 2-methylfumaryl-CoA isomerase [Sulfitobacter sediminilitoris]
MSQILKGMRIVEGSAFVAVPLAGMTLAQMGADVIRFDRIGGGLDAKRWPVAPSGQSLFWAGMNKGKRSIAVDMRAPEGKELITRIITAPGEDAGMFLTNLRVRGWMDHETLSKHRADLIMVTLMGDRHGRPQVDYTVNPALGIPDITGPEGYAEPVANALPAWDLIAGNMVVSSLLAAERHRLRKGEGQDVELSLKDVAAATLGHLGMIGDAMLNDDARGKSGNALYGAYGQDFLCADGKRVMVIGLTGRQWAALVKVTGSGDAIDSLAAQTGLDLKEEGVRWALRHQITEIFKPWFAAQNAAIVGRKLDEAGATWSHFRTVKEAVAEDADLSTDNPMFEMLHQPGLGTFPVPGAPMTFSASARKPAAKAPVLGAHTEEILGDVVGMDDTEISRLFDTGIVQSPNFAVSRHVA